MATRTEKTKLFLAMTSLLGKGCDIEIDIDDLGEVNTFQITAAENTIGGKLNVFYDIEHVCQLASACNLDVFVKVKDNKPVVIVH